MSRFIFYKDSLLSEDLCDQMIRRFESSKDVEVGTTGAGIDRSVKRSTDLEISGKGDWKDVDAALRTSLQRGIDSYCQVNPSLASIDRLTCTGFRLRRYALEEFFDWHIDAFDTSVSARVLASIWYLNDSNVGGETEFLYQEYKVKPKKGRLLLFPTSFEYVHRSTATVQVAKYVAVGFLEHSLMI